MAVDQAVAIATNRFLRDGGIYALPLAKLREQGVFPQEGQTPYMEYPKSIRFSDGFTEVERRTELCDKTMATWTERKELFRDIIVNSEEEEERVLSGGRTSAQLEEERQGLLVRCSAMGIAADPSWSAVRLRRLLGDALDAPAPKDDMAKLEAELAGLRKMAAMQAEIAALKAQLAAPAGEERDELRMQLEELGIEVDQRWSVRTLRAKLEEATAPGVAA